MPSFYPTSLVDTDDLISSHVSTSFYYTDSPTWHPHVSDKSLALVAPIITYWSIYFLWRLFIFNRSPRRRHTQKWQTVRLVAEIQVVQTLFGWVWLTRFGNGDGSDHVAGMRVVGRAFGAVLPSLIGKANAQEFLNQNGEELIQFAYWWAIPVARQFFASFTIDAWQGFLRFLDIDRYLYADVHAFLFDTVGVCLAYSLSGITNREAAIFLVLSTLQTVANRPRHILPTSSLHPRIPLDREVIAKPRENVPFMGFRRQVYQLAHWYFLTLDMQSVDSRRIQRAMQVARHQQATGQKRTRPQLRLDMSCL